MGIIQDRQGRHFVDDCREMFWINGPDDNCYLSEQRQWRTGLTLLETLEWKQCSPTGRISQKFPSVVDACNAFEENKILWERDDQLRRMGDEMERHRSTMNYRPTSMKVAELKGSPVRIPPWIKAASISDASFQAPRCLWPEPRRSVSLPSS